MAFDNLKKTQPRLALELEENYKKNLLPQSILFTGERGSSRLTAALDLAFLLTGEDRDTLRTQSIIYFPHRELLQRLKSSVEMFINSRTQKSKLFLIETLRIINMQYNSQLIAYSPSSISSLFTVADNIDVYLTDLEDKTEITDSDIAELKALIKANHLLDDPRYLYSGKKTPSSVTIDQLRGIKEWMTTTSGRRVVIIEDIESTTENAKNSILKMLEEPLEDFTIILISSQSQRIMETILSRVRKFNFPPLSKETISSLIRDRFNDYNSYSSFETFFFKVGNNQKTVDECEEAIATFVDAISSSKEIPLDKEEEITALLDKLGGYTYFRGRVVEEIEKRLFSSNISPLKCKRLLDILSKYSENIEVYNMSDRLGFDLIERECEVVK